MTVCCGTGRATVYLEFTNDLNSSLNDRFCLGRLPFKLQSHNFKTISLLPILYVDNINSVEMGRID